MPIFFHIESHLWIAYLFFFNGLLLSLALRAAVPRFKVITQPFEALCLSAFFLSISINALMLVVLDWLNLSFGLALMPLVVISVALLVLIAWRHQQSRDISVYFCDYGWLRLLLYLVIFIILFYNGGLIDQLTDAWWHMSMANKIGLASSFNPEFGHLTGAPVRAYPPMWHANLALANVLSGLSIPMFWNSFTAWGSVLKVMAFYLFSFGLTRNVKIALLAAILFFVLPGIGNAYMRVSAWPSHIAYAALYCMFYIFARCVERVQGQEQDTSLDAIKALPKTLFDLDLEFIILGVLAVVVYFTHRAELLWFAVACWCYLAASSIYRSLFIKTSFIAHRDSRNLRLVYQLALVGMFICFAWFFIQQGGHLDLVNDTSIAYLMPVILVLLLLLIELKILPKISFLLLVTILLVSVNYTHLASLLFPDLALARGQFHERPLEVVGYLGQALKLPGWHLQLRGGLLYSGLIAMPLSIILVALRPSKAALFACASSILALLFCASPYLYYWLQTAMSYHSSWRIMILNFHPLVIALCLFSVVQSLKRVK